MAKHPSQQQPPNGGIVLTPAAIGFAAAMFVVGGVVGYLVGTGNAPSTAAVTAEVEAPVVAKAEPAGKVVNNTDGKLRRLSAEEKKELLSKKDDKSKKGKGKDPGVPPADSPYMAAAFVEALAGTEHQKNYESAVAFMAKGNARSAKPLLNALAPPSKGQAWREPVLAMQADAKAATGEFKDARVRITAFRKEFPSSSFTGRVLVAEGKTYMQEGKRSRIGKDVPRDEVAADQKALYEQAIARFDEAVNKHAGDEAVPDALHNKASMLVEMGDLDGAEAAGLALAKDHAGFENGARTLANVGRKAMEAEDYERATRVYEALIEAYPRDRQASAARNTLNSIQLLGKSAPELEVEEWLGDGPNSIADLKGKPVLLVFWATWCPHCKREMPNVEERYQKYKDQGLEILAVTRNSRGQTTEKVREYITQSGYTFPVAIDPGGTSRAYGVSGIPAAALVDKEGNVVFRNHPARIDGAMIEKYL
jgi:peroxiredoxin/outer membrane protein assembly factor BamD (BamD/ComL family)